MTQFRTCVTYLSADIQHMIDKSQNNQFESGYKGYTSV